VAADQAVGAAAKPGAKSTGCKAYAACLVQFDKQVCGGEGKRDKSLAVGDSAAGEI